MTFTSAVAAIIAFVVIVAAPFIVQLCCDMKTTGRKGLPL